jgi:type II secretory pathway component PulF
LKPRSYQAFIADIRGYRPAIAIALSVVAVLPSFMAFVHQDLSALQFLIRFAQFLVVIGALVWVTTGVLVRYARMQHRAERGRSRDDEMMR